jgi:hypothetical protein
MPSRGSRATNSGPLSVDPSSQKDLAKFMRDLRKVAPAVAKETRKRFKDAATPVLNDARSRQPKKTGELRRKTKVRIARGRVEIRSSARHARISEFGGRHPNWGRDDWSRHDPVPAIFPAVDAGRPRFIQAAKSAVDLGAKEAGFK